MSWLEDFPAGLDALECQSLYRRRREVVPLGGARLQVDGLPLLAFCSNDYLGMAADPALRLAVHAAVEAYGVGSGASPMISGHSAANAALERDLARAVGQPRALYFYAGYATNASIIPALVGAGDALFSDALNHACLIDGARLSKATVHRYAHLDLDRLEAQLRASPARRKLVISDAVFSMDGDVADIARLLALCERWDALLLLDDAHGFGVRGPRGRGSLAAAALTNDAASRRVLYMATLGKALGVAGAFVAGPEALVEWLLQKTRSYTYATAAPALLAEAARASLKQVLSEEGDRRRARLKVLVARLQERLAPGASAAIDAAGWRLLPSNTAIQSLVTGDNDRTLAIMDGLQRLGFWVPAIRPPTVPEGSARLRIALSATHALDDLDALCSALKTLAESRRSGQHPYSTAPTARVETHALANDTGPSDSPPGAVPP